MVARALDEGRIGGFERQHAMLFQIYGTLESAATDSGHDLGLAVARGMSDPDARLGVHWSPAEASAVIAWHREAAALQTAKKQLMTPIGKATPKVKSEHHFRRRRQFAKVGSCCGETCRAQPPAPPPLVPLSRDSNCSILQMDPVLFLSTVLRVLTQPGALPFQGTHRRLKPVDGLSPDYHVRKTKTPFFACSGMRP